MVVNIKEKDVSEQAKVTYLNSVTHLHINYDVILAQKTSFLIAVSALILTLSISEILSSSFITLPSLLQISIGLIAVGNAVGILLLLKAENFRPSRLSKAFHPLSLEEFHNEAKKDFLKDVKNILSSENKIINDFSNQIFLMKKDMFRKTKVIKLARRFIISPLFVATILVAIQLYIFLI